ncbi:MAG: pitrilysin family protein [Burkholderiaceae bacterium]
MKALLRSLAVCAVFFLPPALSAKATAPAPALPAGVQKVATVEGITEYRLPNGLRFILFPDASKPTATVNVTYLVGSRHENYGETGMAHLLEHLIFKGSKNYPSPDKEFTRRGFRMNGTTSQDRTNYFVSFTATEDNLKWALGWTADAMVNSFIAKKDLDTEMTVVRNEFEMGENQPTQVMFKRLQAMLFDWHNYGKSTIGARSDIENVKIENLQAFYRRYYQPDNAVLTVSGKFDEAKTLAQIAADFGQLAKPTRVLPPEWTVEPTADGERSFQIRRKGEIQLLTVAYRIPSSLHADADALAFAADSMADTPNGRLYKALVQPGLAAQVFAWTIGGKAPGFVMFGAVIKKGEPVAPVRAKMIEVIETSLKTEPFTEAELQRNLQQQLTNYERALSDPEAFGVGLSEYIALGDWRLFFYSRDQLAKVKPAQVDAAVAKYFVRDNRVVGLFEPDDAPQRAEIPAAPKAAALLANYQAKIEGDRSEAFDSSQDNLDRRTRIINLGDLKVALLPKQNRGQTVTVAINFQWGDEKTLANRDVDGSLALAMLSRGTDSLTRQQIADDMTRLKMQGGLTGFETTRENLPAALKLVAQVYQRASFPEPEFDELKRQTLTGLQAQMDDPSARSRDALAAHFNTYPKGDPRYYIPLADRIDATSKSTLAGAKAYYKDLVGTARGQIAIVGDFDEKAVEAELKQLFPAKASASPYARVDREYRAVAPARIAIDTPDKENATLRARIDLPLRDTDPKAAALYVADWIFGGGTGLSSRLMNRLRQKDGLSYGAGSGLSLGSRRNYSSWSLGAIVAPQNLAKAEAAIREEFDRARKEGFTAQEVEEAKKGILQSRAVNRAQDGTVASAWVGNLDLDRSWQFSKAFEQQIAAVTPEQVNAAFRQYIDPAAMSFVVAGDAKKGAK